MTWKEIEAGSKAAQKYHFDKERFEGTLWAKGKTIYIAYIKSKEENKGNFKCWLTNLSMNKSLTIKVVRPVEATCHILNTIGGFEKVEEDLPYPTASKRAEVWVREGI